MSCCSVASDFNYQCRERDLKEEVLNFSIHFKKKERNILRLIANQYIIKSVKNVPIDEVEDNGFLVRAKCTKMIIIYADPEDIETDFYWEFKETDLKNG